MVSPPGTPPGVASLPQESLPFVDISVKRGHHGGSGGSRPKPVMIEGKTEDQRFALRVADDGVGFEASTLTEVAGFGLFSIAERISNQGGKMEVTSAPGQGNMATIALPLSQ